MLTVARRVTMWHGSRMRHHEDLIGSTEAAQILSKSPRTVHRMVKSGVLKPAVVAPGGFAGSYMFHRRDVERLIKSADHATSSPVCPPGS